MCIRVSPLKWNANEENTETTYIHQTGEKFITWQQLLGPLDRRY